MSIAIFMMMTALAVQDGSRPPLKELPSLDEALGIAPKETGAVSRDPLREELEKALGRGQESDLLAEAADLMARSAERLEESDAGLATQRLQEDAIRKLDALIAQAQNNQQSQQSKKKKQQQQQSQQQQAQQQQSQQQAAAASTSPATQALPGPAGQEAQLRAAKAAAEATWGNLPPHLRDALRQGRSEQFSSLYQRLTEQYYKRLAEEPKK